MSRPTRFTRGTNPGTRTCIHCGKRTWASRMEGNGDTCERCWEGFGLENEHNDNGGHTNGPDMDCPVCQAKTRETDAS